MNVTFRKLETLCEQLRKEQKIMRSRITPNKIKVLHKRRLCHFQWDKAGICVGFGAIWPTRKTNWFELGSIWVHPNFRSEGNGSKIFNQTVSLAPKGAILFLITLSSKVVHIAKHNRWEEVIRWQQSSQWKNVCEPWDKHPNEQPRIFPKGGRLFYHITPD